MPSWGEAKLAGYDSESLDALYRKAARGLPAGASYRDVLARMRAQGGVADSPAAQAGEGGGGKPPKDTAAAPQPDGPRKPNENEGNGIIDTAKAREHRAMCREILENGNAAQRYEALQAWEGHGYESWMDDQVRAEILKHDATWVRGGASPAIDIESGARPMEKEMACAESLSAVGFKVTFRATRAASKMRTSNLYILENGEDIAWEMKQPTGNGRQTISHQFEEAAGQSDRLIIDATAFQQGSRWSDGDALAKECEKLIRYHFKDSEGNAMRFSEVLIVEDANEAVSIRRIIRV